MLESVSLAVTKRRHKHCNVVNDIVFSLFLVNLFCLHGRLHKTMFDGHCATTFDVLILLLRKRRRYGHCNVVDDTVFHYFWSIYFVCMEVFAKQCLRDTQLLLLMSFLCCWENRWQLISYFNKLNQIIGEYQMS